jgi:adenylyltransferase/sulfurtransferase
MAVTVLIPTALRVFAERKAEVSSNGKTAGEVLQNLVKTYPQLKKHLFSEEKKLRSFINIFLGDTNIKNIKGLETKLKDGDVLMIIPAIAGGAGRVSACYVPPDDLTNEEIARYSRHLLLPEIGIEGQKKLKNAKVLIVGTGGLGSPLGLYLAAAGVGTLGIMDFDFVDESNLQRQIIHGIKDVGRPKVASAKDRIKSINQHINVVTYNQPLTSENALEIISKYDIVADGTDNFQTRYITNDACKFLGKPNVYGSVFQFEGQVSVFYAKEGPCYRCLFDAPPPPGLVPSCAEGGVLGVLAGIVGTLQANEVIKLITGAGKSLIGRLLTFDALNMSFREVKIPKDESCPLCGKKPSLLEMGNADYYSYFCGLSETAKETTVDTILPAELKKRIDKKEKLQLIDIREPHERAIVKFPNAKAIPPGQLVRRMDELNPRVSTVVICKEGKKSVLSIEDLQQAGYKGKLFNLAGGINGWAKEVDRSVPIY